MCIGEAVGEDSLSSLEDLSAEGACEFAGPALDGARFGAARLAELERAASVRELGMGSR